MSTFEPNWDTFNLSAADSNATSDERPPDPALPKGPPPTDQDIVPQLLIDHFVSMIDPSRAQTVDSDIARHCAFSLPAVALTIGRSNWPLLKDTYEALATDMQWKVRRTLASSIHELGIILGQEAAGTDLIPIFNGFLKDLDEVRIGLLKHLADFLKVLSDQDRCNYLPKLDEFLKMDNDRNWRFRLELTEQLEKLVPLYSPDQVEEHIAPIAMVLVRDKVAAVRSCAIDVVAFILKDLNTRERPDLAKSLMTTNVESLAEETLWVHRQTYASLALRINKVGGLTLEQFAENVLPKLIELSEDIVPNVRLAVARTLGAIGTKSDQFNSTDRTSDYEKLAEVEAKLKVDDDVDVRMFLGGAEKTYNSLHVLNNQQQMTDLDMNEDADLGEAEDGLLQQREEDNFLDDPADDEDQSANTEVA